jgi:HSP20 family protein
MALIRWEPARELQSFQQEVNRLFGTVFDSQAGGGHARALRRWVPAVDLVEEGDQYVLRADLPGVREQDVKVEVKENVLTVSGERHSEHEDRRDGYYRVERSSGRFSRSLLLPDGVDPEAVRARYENGVLEVSVPKPERPQPHRVSIDVAAGAAALPSDTGQPAEGEAEPQQAGAAGQDAAPAGASA